jgi:catecholate siderophore receptor
MKPVKQQPAAKNTVHKVAMTGVALALSMGSHSVWAQEASSTVSDDTLPTIVVDSEQTREQRGFKPTKTRVGKTAQEVKDIPQAITVITEQLMHDKNADSLKEALRNVAGVTFNAGEGGRIGDNITIRGYSAVGDLYLDNMRDAAQYNRETFNLEQIDVLKGSSSMLFGRGSTGGVINQVSKIAKPVDAYEANLTVGSNNYKRGTVDLNKAITDNVSFRLNAMKTKADSFRDGVSKDRWGAAPTLTIGSGTQNEITLSYYHLQENNIPDFGIPYFQNKPLNVPIERFYGMSNADYEDNKTGIATASYTHLFSNDSSIKTTVRDSRYERDMRASAPRLTSAANALSIANGTAVVNRQRQARGAKEHQFNLQSDFNTKFTTGKLKHEFIGGIEYVNESANRWTNTNTSAANPATTVGNTNTNPVLSEAFLNNWSRTAPNSYKGQTYSMYVQDTVEFLPGFKFMGGVRYDSMKADYTRSTGGDLSRKDAEISGRAGLLYQPNPNSTYYVSYSTGFNPSAELYQLDNRSQNTDPEKTRNMEIGAKWNLLNDDLSLRTSLSRSEKTNERNTDLAIPDVYLLSGKRHTDAFEFEAVGRITDKWEVFANYAYMKAKIDRAAGSAANTQGNVPANTPRYTYSLWTTYKLPYGFKVGGGIEGVGKRYANATNTTSIPGYTRVDALIEYQATKKIDVKLNVKNLLNRKYYESIYTGHILPGTSRAYEFTLTAKF